MSETVEEEMEPIESDLKAILADAKKLGPLTTTQDLVTFIKSNLVPFIETHVTETLEQSATLDDLIGQADDILQPETAKVFAAVIVGGAAMAAMVRELAPKGPDGKMLDQARALAVAEYEGVCKTAGELLGEITLPDRDDEYEDDEDDEEDDDETEEEDE